MAGSAAQRRQREPWPIVTYPHSNVAAVYFLDAGPGPAREVVDVDAGDLTRPADVPLGYLLTEVLAGRAEVSPEHQADSRRDQMNLGVLTALYLTPRDGSWVPAYLQDGLRSLREWHNSAKTPRARYRVHWRLHTIAQVREAFGFADGHAGRRSPLLAPFAIHKRVHELYDIVSNPLDVVQRWRRQALQVSDHEAPLYCFIPQNTVDSALIELWWAIDHNRTVHWCKDCEAPFVITGSRSWLQGYCAVHRAEGSAARMRAARREEPRNGGTQRSGRSGTERETRRGDER